MSPQVAVVALAKTTILCSGVPAYARTCGHRCKGGREWFAHKENSIIPVEWVCDRLDLPSADTKCGLRRKGPFRVVSEGGAALPRFRLLEE